MARFGLRDDQIRGYAAGLKENPLFQGIMEEVQDGAIQTWIAHPPTDSEAHAAAWHAYHTIEAVRTLISNSVEETETEEIING